MALIKRTCLFRLGWRTSIHPFMFRKYGVSGAHRCVLHTSRLTLRNEAGTEGGGNSGTATSTIKKPSAATRISQSSATSKSIAIDPHLAAADRIAVNRSSERLQAAEALNLVDRRVRLKNIATAAVLFGFASGVCWYSMNAVGRGDSALELKELEEAAAEARRVRDDKKREEDEIRGLIDDEEELIDEEKDLIAGDIEKGERRPLWRKIVFFWRRD